jgi:hypothetical protein
LILFFAKAEVVMYLARGRGEERKQRGNHEVKGKPKFTQVKALISQRCESASKVSK